MSDQVTNTLREFDDFAFAPEFEINLVVSRRSVIHGFFEIEKGFHDWRGNTKLIQMLSRSVSPDTMLSTHSA